MRKRIAIVLALLLLLGLVGVGLRYFLPRRGSGDYGPGSGVESETFELPTPDLLLDADSARGGTLATLVRLERSVKSKRADELVWEPAEKEMSLFKNDAVRTFERSRANILFGHGDVIEVDENTLIIIAPRKSSNDDEISMALLSPALLAMIAEQPEEEQERLLQEAMTSREVRVVKIAGGGADGKGVRVGVKTLSDNSNALVSRSGTVKVIGPDGTEIILDEKTATMLGADGVLSAPRQLLGPPTLMSPRDGSVFAFQRKSPQVKLKWKPIKDAKAYRILMARDPEFKSIFVEETVRRASLVAHNLEPGRYYWRVKARDADGIEGAFSSIRTIKAVRDDTPPRLAIAFPPDMFVSPDPRVEVKGKTDRGARVRINGRTVPVAADGGFSHLLSLSEGAMLITVEAIDSAGNVEYGKRLVTYRGKRAPVARLSGRP